MSKMKELYGKVAKDSALQTKFAEIMKEAENAGEEVTKEKLLAFAKEADYDVSVEEMSRFFKDLTENKSQLSEMELDMVAGGKGGDIDWGKITAGAIIVGSVAAGATGAGAAVSVGCIVGAGTVEGATR